MSDVVVHLIDLNENINYSSFITFFCSYLIALWLVVSIWVGVDAYRRFNNQLVAFAFFLLTFVLNFPILIFYFIIRPEFKYEEFEEWETGGVNVPIVNFKGKDGTTTMVLELKINPLNLATTQNDMKIDVSWESPKKEFELQSSKESVESSDSGLPPRADRKIITTFRNLGGIVSKKIERVKEISSNYVKHYKAKPKDSGTRSSKTKFSSNKAKSKNKKNKKKGRK